MPLNTCGPLYSRYSTQQAKPPYDETSRACVERTVSKLLVGDTTTAKPGMLLGKIQCGKTRTFLGVIALAFDNGFGVAVVLTKNSTALTDQTVKRIKKDLAQEDVIQVFDIMAIPRLTAYDLTQKLVIVVKKEDDNMNRLLELFEKDTRALLAKKVIIVDDEADHGSVGFRNRKEVGLVINTIPGQIDDFRKLAPETAFLQVTATPYSLYLQPDQVSLGEITFKPLRPAFTSLVPVPKDYIGTDFFFDQCHDPEHPSSKMLVIIPDEELDALKEEDGRKLKIDRVLGVGIPDGHADNARVVREALLGFLIGATIRRMQQQSAGQPLQRYSFLVHTHTSRRSHEWQARVVTEMIAQLEDLVMTNYARADLLLRMAYEDLLPQLRAHGITPPSAEDVVNTVAQSIRDRFVTATVVNSDEQVQSLLDDDGELRRQSPMSIFIGGQVLDRGLTIKNLIGFYYGRNPKRSQQDTVLQHMRICGYRTMADVSVTRIYCGTSTKQALIRIHRLDQALRESVEKDPDAPVVFIAADEDGKVIPCSPSKIRMSETSCFKSHSRELPVGFKTANKAKVLEGNDTVEGILNRLRPGASDKPFLVPIKEAVDILRAIEPTLDMEEDADIFVWENNYKALAMMARDAQGAEKDHVWILPLGVWDKPRELKKTKLDGSYSDAPETSKTDYGLIKSCAETGPGIILVKQSGAKELGWSGVPFFWPVIVSPGKVRTVIFAHKTQRD